MSCLIAVSETEVRASQTWEQTPVSQISLLQHSSMPTKALSCKLEVLTCLLQSSKSLADQQMITINS